MRRSLVVALAVSVGIIAISTLAFLWGRSDDGQTVRHLERELERISGVVEELNGRLAEQDSRLAAALAGRPLETSVAPSELSETVVRLEREHAEMREQLTALWGTLFEDLDGDDPLAVLEHDARRDKERAMAQMVAQGEHSVPVLVEALQRLPRMWELEEKPPFVVQTLIKIGEPAVPPLVELLQERSLEKIEGQMAILEVLRLIGPRAGSAVQVIARNLDHETWDVMEKAAQALGEIGVGSDFATAVLQAVLEREGEDRDVTGAARGALKKLGEE